MRDCCGLVFSEGSGQRGKWVVLHCNSEIGPSRGRGNLAVTRVPGSCAWVDRGASY